MGVNPEIAIIEGAEGRSLARRQYPAATLPNRWGLPGARARVESPRNRTEQERPTGNRGEVAAGAWRQGTTGAVGVKGRWESDPFIVALKPAKSGISFERVERREGLGKEPEGGRVGQYSEIVV